MTWAPQYTISNKLLLTIREIGESIGEIKAQHLSHTTLAKLELNARELSSYASTSIEGNPLPLTDVKRLLKNEKDIGTLKKRIRLLALKTYCLWMTKPPLQKWEARSLNSLAIP